MSSKLTPQQEGRAHGAVLMQAIAKPFHVYSDARANLLFEHGYWQRVAEVATAETQRISRLIEQTNHTTEQK